MPPPKMLTVDTPVFELKTTSETTITVFTSEIAEIIVKALAWHGTTPLDSIKFDQQGNSESYSFIVKAKDGRTSAQTIVIPATLENQIDAKMAFLITGQWSFKELSPEGDIRTDCILLTMKYKCSKLTYTPK